MIRYTNKITHTCLQAFIFFLPILCLLVSCQTVLKLKKWRQKKLQNQTNSLSMEFVLLPSGEFSMGCTGADLDCDEDEKPQHTVHIDKDFWFAKAEVTRGDFAKFVAATRYKTDAEKLHSSHTWKNCHGHSKKDSLPVICVSWNDAKAFAKWLSQKEGKTYRLPSEAEWEYAARGNSPARFFWGIDMDDTHAWFKKNAKRSPHPIKTKIPNAYDIYDTAGNVWEWCRDDYIANKYKFKTGDKKELLASPLGKVLRGGSWFEGGSFQRASTRSFAPAASSDEHYGFRLLREN